MNGAVSCTGLRGSAYGIEPRAERNRKSVDKSVAVSELRAGLKAGPLRGIPTAQKITRSGGLRGVQEKILVF